MNFAKPHEDVCLIELKNTLIGLILKKISTKSTPNGEIWERHVFLCRVSICRDFTLI